VSRPSSQLLERELLALRQLPGKDPDAAQQVDAAVFRFVSTVLDRTGRLVDPPPGLYLAVERDAAARKAGL